jgi:RsiW-degrading membrane proteinase PrsW (M82 family)
MMKKRYRSLISTWFLLPAMVFGAPQPKAPGLGDVANSLMDPVTIVANFIGTISMILGFCFLFATIVKYGEYRRNSYQTPVSTVIILFILGILLLLIPLAYKLTDTGFPTLL